MTATTKELLSVLFQRLGADEEFSDELDVVAEYLAGQDPDRMYEYLSDLSGHHIVERRKRFFTAQPAPVANFLGARRLDRTRVSTILKFIEVAPPALLTSFFERWRYFDRTRAAPIVAERLMRPDGMLGTMDGLNQEAQSEIFNCLVHVAPDLATDVLDRVFRGVSVDDLHKFVDGRRHLISALEKLCFRKASFSVSARLLMRLAATETEQGSNNASGQFKQLFQLQLSGTEAAPVERFALLDDGLASGDDRIVAVCLDALDNTLGRNHSSRSIGAEQIGSGPHLKDWHPKIWGDVYAFHQEGLKRLEALWGTPAYASRCEKMFSSHLRTLLSPVLLNDLNRMIERVVAAKGIWFEAIQAVGDWLYFDGSDAPNDFTQKVTGLYAKLMPTDVVEKAILYTRFWAANIRDPDVRYSRESNFERDYRYSTQKALGLAKEIAADPALIAEAITKMAGMELNNAFEFARELGLNLDTPDEAVAMALDAYERSTGNKTMQFVRGLLSGIDARDEVAGNRCIDIALEYKAFADDPVGAFSAVRLTNARLASITQLLKDGRIAAGNCNFLSYGRGLDHLSAEEIAPFIDELFGNHGPAGIWTALEVLSMYLHGREDLDSILQKRLKTQLTSARILERGLNANRDGFVFETLVGHIQKFGTFDDKFAEGLAAQVVGLCEITDYKVFHALDSTFTKIVSILVKDRPNAIWAAVSRFYEVASPSEKHRLEDLLGSSRRGEEYLGAGVLFEVPEDIPLGWAREAPANRVEFLCSFYPILIDQDDGEKAWHPAFARLAGEFGGHESFQRRVFRRLGPNAWWGSRAPFLQVFLKPLEAWFEHENAALARWARETYRLLEREAQWENSRFDEEM